MYVRSTGLLQGCAKKAIIVENNHILFPWQTKVFVELTEFIKQARTYHLQKQKKMGIRATLKKITKNNGTNETQHFSRKKI